MIFTNVAIMTICGHCHGNKCEDNHVLFMVMETHSSPHPWFCAGRGVKVRATRGRPPSGWLHRLSPTRDLCQGLASGLHRGLGAQQGPTLAKAVAFGWFVVSRVVLVERLVVDALW